MAGDFSVNSWNVRELEFLLRYFTDEEIQKLFYDKTKAAMDKSIISQLTNAQIKDLHMEISTLASEYEERKMDIRPRPLSKKPKNFPNRFSDQTTRKKTNVLTAFYRAQRVQQREAKLAAFRALIAQAKEELNRRMTCTPRPESAESKRKIDLVVIGKKIKIHEPELEEDKTKKPVKGGRKQKKEEQEEYDQPIDEEPREEDDEITKPVKATLKEKKQKQEHDKPEGSVDKQLKGKNEEMNMTKPIRIESKQKKQKQEKDGCVKLEEPVDDQPKAEEEEMAKHAKQKEKRDDSDKIEQLVTKQSKDEEEKIIKPVKAKHKQTNQQGKQKRERNCGKLEESVNAKPKEEKRKTENPIKDNNRPKKKLEIGNNSYKQNEPNQAKKHVKNEANNGNLKKVTPTSKKRLNTKNNNELKEEKYKIVDDPEKNSLAKNGNLKNDLKKTVGSKPTPETPTRPRRMVLEQMYMTV